MWASTAVNAPCMAEVNFKDRNTRWCEYISIGLVTDLTRAKFYAPHLNFLQGHRRVVQQIPRSVHLAELAASNLLLNLEVSQWIMAHIWLQRFLEETGKIQLVTIHAWYQSMNMCTHSLFLCVREKQIKNKVFAGFLLLPLVCHWGETICALLKDKKDEGWRMWVRRCQRCS